MAASGRSHLSRSDILLAIEVVVHVGSAAMFLLLSMWGIFYVMGVIG